MYFILHLNEGITPSEFLYRIW